MSITSGYNQPENPPARCCIDRIIFAAAAEEKISGSVTISHNRIGPPETPAVVTVFLFNCSAIDPATPLLLDDKAASYTYETKYMKWLDATADRRKKPDRLFDYLEEALAKREKLQ